MVTTSVTYLEDSERCFVAHGEVVGVTHKGSDQAPLHGRRAGRGVRSQQAHDAQGPERALGDGGAFALHAWSWGRVLPAAGPSAPLLGERSVGRGKAEARPAEGGRGSAGRGEGPRIRGRAGAG